MRFSRDTRSRLVVALVAALVIAGLIGLVNLVATPESPTADELSGAPWNAAAPVPSPPAPPAPPRIPLPPPVRLPPPALSPPPVPTVLIPPVPRPSPPSPPCVAPPGSTQRDVDVTDPPDAVWPRARGQKVVVYVETGRLPPRYADAVVAASRLWSRSTCVEAVAVLRCPPRSLCSTAVTQASGGGDELNGDSRSTSRDDQRIRNAITLYTDPLDPSTDNVVLGTVVHEMGHALGLRHRADPRSVMNATTGDDTDPRPDAIDFWNLAVLYGEGAP